VTELAAMMEACACVMCAVHFGAGTQRPLVCAVRWCYLLHLSDAWKSVLLGVATGQ
jgi:hypothetical protein